MVGVAVGVDESFVTQRGGAHTPWRARKACEFDSLVGCTSFTLTAQGGGGVSTLAPAPHPPAAAPAAATPAVHLETLLQVWVWVLV